MAAAKKKTGPNENLKTALAQIRKQYGEGSVMKMGDKLDMKVEVLPTGVLALDVALGVGGLPRGRVVETYGAESGGKSTLALTITAETQRRGGIVAYLDVEQALDPDYAAALGVDVDELYISQPDSGEQALEITETLIRSGEIDLIVVDSVAALTPQAEIEGDMGQAHVGLQARMMSQAMRKITANLNKTKTTIIFINQIREKIGVQYGSPETQPGGRALKFYSSIRLDIRRIGSVKSGEEVIGNETRIKVVKNKVARPFTMCEVELIYGEGFSNESSLISWGLEYGILSKSGNWIAYGDQQIGNGKEKTRQALKDHPALAEEIQNKIWVAMGYEDESEEGVLGVVEEEPVVEDPAEDEL